MNFESLNAELEMRVKDLERAKPGVECARSAEKSSFFAEAERCSGERRVCESR